MRAWYGADLYLPSRIILIWWGRLDFNFFPWPLLCSNQEYLIFKSPSRCTITEIEPQIQVAKPSEPSVSMDTKIVCMSDPSTHFPGNSLENSPDDGWSNHTSSSVSNTDSSFELLKKTEKKPSFLSKKKKWLKEKKWLRKKTPVALPC